MSTSKRIDLDLDTFCTYQNLLHLLQGDETVFILLCINRLIGTIGYSGQNADSQSVPIKRATTVYVLINTVCLIRY